MQEHIPLLDKISAEKSAKNLACYQKIWLLKYKKETNNFPKFRAGAKNFIRRKFCPPKILSDI